MNQARNKVCVIIFALCLRAFAYGDSGRIIGDPMDGFVVQLASELQQLSLNVAVENYGSTEVKWSVVVTDESVTVRVRSSDGRMHEEPMAKFDPVQVAERVRALLLTPLPPLPVTKSPTARTNQLVPRVEEQHPPTGWSLSFGTGVFRGAESWGFSVMPGLEVSPAAWQGRQFSGFIALRGLLQVTDETLEREDASADLSTAMLGLEISLRFARADWAAELGGGVWISHLRAKGETIQLLMEHVDGTWSIGPEARVRISKRFARISLYGEAMTGTALPGVNVRFVGEHVADWGTPWVSLGAGIVVNLHKGEP